MPRLWSGNIWLPNCHISVLYLGLRNIRCSARRLGWNCWLFIVILSNWVVLITLQILYPICVYYWLLLLRFSQRGWFLRRFYFLLLFEIITVVIIEYLLLIILLLLLRHLLRLLFRNHTLQWLLNRSNGLFNLLLYYLLRLLFNVLVVIIHLFRLSLLFGFDYVVFASWLLLRQVLNFLVNIFIIVVNVAT